MRYQHSTENSQMQQRPQQLNTDSTAAGRESVALSSLGNVLLLIGETIIVTTKEDSMTLLAAYIKLTAGGLEVAAACLEANETATGMNLPPNTITPTGRQKIEGAIISEIGGLILTDVLQKEIEERRGRRVNTILSPFIAGLGSFSV